MNTERTFRADLDRAAEEYLTLNNLKPRGSPYMNIKAVILFTLFICSLLVTLFVSIWFEPLVGFFIAGIGFNIGHDASHYSFSEKLWVNKTLVLFFDWSGVSSTLWEAQHVKEHHEHVNDEKDPDIHQNPFFRLSLHQPRRWWHRFQAWYAIPLYTFSHFSWSLAGDMNSYRKKKVRYRKVSFTPYKHLVFWLGKTFFIFTFIVLPFFFYPPLQAIQGFFLFIGTSGLVTTLIFQPAHAVSGSEFTTAATEPDKWKRQVRETTNFASGNNVTGKVVCWILGGLNHQIEHHLFTLYSHHHYPALAPIVKKICEKHNVPYKSLSFWRAIVSHFKHLNEMGKK